MSLVEWHWKHTFRELSLVNVANAAISKSSSSSWFSNLASSLWRFEGPWQASQLIFRVRKRVRYRFFSGKYSKSIWLPWQFWQLEVPSMVPNIRCGVQCARSFKEISLLTGVHSFPSCNCTNQRFSSLIKSKGRKRMVPSGNFVKKLWVPPPYMWPPPTTASTLIILVGRLSCSTIKTYSPFGVIFGVTTASLKTRGLPSNFAMISTLPGSPPALPWVEFIHRLYSFSWHSLQDSEPAKSSKWVLGAFISSPGEREGSKLFRFDWVPGLFSEEPELSKSLLKPKLL